MIFNSIRSKIVISSCLCLVVAGTAIITLATLSVRHTAIRKAHDQIRFLAQDRASHIEIELNHAMTSINTLAGILKKVKNPLNPIMLEREEINFFLQSVLKTNKNLVGAYTCWSPNGFDNNDKMYMNEPGHDETGRFALYWYQNKNGIFEVEPLQHEEITDLRDYKDIQQCVISDPHIRNIGGKDFSVISFIIPIGSGKEYLGFVGIDICCYAIQNLVREIDIEGKNGQILIINSNQKILGLTDRPDMICKDLTEIIDHIEIDLQKMTAIKPFTISSQDEFQFYTPITFIKSKPLWVIVSLSRKDITLEAAVLSKNLIFTGIVCILVSLFFLWFFAARIVHSLGLLIKGTERIGQGNYGIQIDNINTRDEIGKLASTINIMSTEINKKEIEKNKFIKNLNEAEEKYRAMMEAMDDPVTICTRDYKIKYMNPAMIRRIGRDAAGEKCFKAIHDIKEKCPWCMAYKTQQGIFFKTDIVSPKDNNSYHISHSPVIYEDGTISKMTVFRDTTDLKKLESQLVQAQKMESIGNLAGGIAHDFNNLLFPIIGMSEMLLEDLPQDSLEHENVQEIFTAGRRAGELVNQILAFSRQSKHKMTPVRVQNVLKEVLKLGRSTIPTNIEIQQNIQQNCGLVMADATQIHQVAMNLITNAYHAVGSKNGAIDIELKEISIEENELPDKELPPGKHVRFSVSDSGIGMAQSTINKIFEPYFTTKEKGKGTGLGLAVVYGIVKEHRGEIEVYSEVGKGTTFCIYLPLMKKATEFVSTEQTSELVTGTEKILLVDDEVSVAKLEGKMLSRLGYQVTLTTDSKEALNKFKLSPDSYDIVISDMTMPNMTGDQLAKELLSIKADIPIIICTGFSERINKEQAEMLGVKGFLMKPVVKSDMAQMVRKMLDEAKDL